MPKLVPKVEPMAIYMANRVVVRLYCPLNQV